MDSYEHWLGKLIGWFNDEELYAVTLGQTTYYSCPFWAVYDRPWWKLHEDKHKEQWKRIGRIRFACSYIWQNLTVGYHKNKWEIEANEASSKGQA